MADTTSLELKPYSGEVGPTRFGALWSTMTSATHENTNACAGQHAQSEDSPRTPNGTRDGTRNRVYGCASNSYVPLHPSCTQYKLQQL